MIKRRITFWVVTAIVTSFVAHTARGESPSVTAVLDNSEASVGQTVQLQIRVIGARNVDLVPETIAIDGLEIHRTGTEQHYQMDNFTVSSSVNYNYTILPMRAGTFKIPPQTIQISGRTYKTPALTLNVAALANQPARPQSGGNPASSSKLAFAELVMTSKTAYVGEVIPAEIRLGFAPRTQPRQESDPEIKGQGFTAQTMQQPRQSLQTLGGRTYAILTYKTAISPARTGLIEIGPAEMKAQIMVPPQSNGRSRPRSPFDQFDDPFSDPFFDNPFGAFGEPREVTIKSESVSLEVKPLPLNAPSTFSGAIGTFTMNVEAKPKKVQVGDPITIDATISGRGNFDRMTAPTLEDDQGWHKYPPSAKFKQDDDVGISGTKTFEIVISPNEKKTTIPPLVFSYFDPIKQNYVTLHSEAIPIEVEGQSVAATPAGTAVAEAAPPVGTPAATPQPSSKPQDILYQLSDFGRIETFKPVYARQVFWLAQLVPLALLLGYIGWKIRQARINNRQARRMAALHHESVELLRKLRRGDLSPQEYFSDASRAVRVKAALARNVDPNMVDVDLATSAFDLDENSRNRLRRLFERSDELLYSGRPNGGDTTSAQDRREILKLIESLRS